MSLEFGGSKETYKCTRIQFIQLQFDEDFQEDAETRSNHGVLLKRAAVLTGLLSEMGAGDSVGLFAGNGPLSYFSCYTAHPYSFTSCTDFPPWWPL